ncbi:hypothetical protein P608_10160 [Comamonas thiooxydans]|uniref:Uncharacterized protein n=1 Tax=Comamonas thiooxydans TaxID=363952 RepID=A0A0E3C1Z6_9BURK|nr:hypothetical protein P608_10160 [Comamonas thiooxydans]KGH17205.1 hypothetical protein P607_18245 [Comamonas thiooxydans]
MVVHRLLLARLLHLVLQLVPLHQLKAVVRDRGLPIPNPHAAKAAVEGALTTTFRSLVFTTWPVVKH